jgi:hypothetical protein
MGVDTSRKMKVSVDKWLEGVTAVKKTLRIGIERNKTQARLDFNSTNLNEMHKGTQE